jgi:hypothetical protein
MINEQAFLELPKQLWELVLYFYQDTSQNVRPTNFLKTYEINCLTKSLSLKYLLL